MKTMAWVAVVLLGTVSWAGAGDITFTVSSPADQQFQIGYAATDPAMVPVAIGLKVTVTGSCSATVSGGDNVVSASAEFDVAIDYAHDLPDPNDYTIGMAGQHPLADPCGAGVVDPGSSVFSIWMGRLDPCTAASQNVPNLVTIQLDCQGVCNVTVSIEEDELRGGVLGADWDTLDAVDSISGVCGWDYPACWDCPSQCYGDCDCDGEYPDVDTVDWPCFRDAFGYSYPAVEYNPCADVDRDGDVDTVDWPVFRSNFGYTVPGDCPPGGVWPPVPY